MPVMFFLTNFWELMPMTSPREFSSGPPLLPGLMGASVWIQVPGPAASKGPTALTMPLVTLKSMASPGFPMATTLSPWRTVLASASGRWSEAGARSFGQRNIQVRIDVDDFCLELRAIRQGREQSFFAARQMGIGGDYTGLRDEETGAALGEAFEIDHRGLGAAHQFFQRELRAWLRR